MSTNAETPTAQSGHCLNCGAELQGRYCHSCGQEAVIQAPSIVGFVKEYLKETFIWDPRFFPTLWALISRPGRLTNDFLAGKIVSQEHPIKLNMFLLFVFITLFVFFAGTEKMTDSVHSLTSDESVLTGIQIRSLMDDPAYTEKLQESPRDTILLQAPLRLAEQYPALITRLDIKEDVAGEELDKWVAVLPRLLITEGLLVMGEGGYYRFNAESEIGKTDLELVNSVFDEMLRITSKYFPILLLLTTPFLAMSLGLVQRKSRVPRIHHFIFSLHYTAFLEFFIICIYILYLTVAPSMNFLEHLMLIGSCVYLTIAFRRVYAGNWWRAIVKAFFTSLIYYMILLFIFVGILFVACFVIIVDTL